ncbi:efflux RND transporter permease subunit [Pelosinus sp. sgz500959]|uniref:efflux RND transporter permease subunit n=1 Tax=Pelosinus sp. sgz500959 TaxID=3242472 RepID=UPI00366C6118
MAKFFIDRPIFAIVLSIVITLVGLISAFNLPIAQYPQITPPQVSVSGSYTGANAEVVEQTMAQSIELQVNGTEDMVSMTSTSSDSGSYTLTAKFDLSKNADMATVQTQNRVAQANASLPTEVTTAGLTTRKVSPDNSLIFTLSSPKGTYDSTFLKNYGSIYLVEDLKRIKGVGNIMEYGADYGMRIWLHPDKMAQLGLTGSDVSNAITTQNVQAPAGTIGQRPTAAQQEFQYSARVQGRLTEPSEFENIIISSKDNNFIRLKDIATVEMGGKDYGFQAFLNGDQAVAFAVQLTTDANALETITKVQQALEEASKKFPSDVSYFSVVDNTKFVRESMKEVAKTFAEALLLVLLVVFLFLQSWRATLIPMLAIPVSLIGTFGAFMVMGFSINTLTLFAMVLAIGLVVDDAIIVIEAVEHHMRYNGMSPKDATKLAMSEVSGPVVAIAFVLASVFIPVAFFGGTTGVLYKQFALTIAVSMALSAIVALSLTPALCALVLKPHDPNAHSGILETFFNKFNDLFEATVERYGKGLAKFIKRSALGVVFLAVLLLVTGKLFQLVPSSFVPSEDQGYFISSISLPEAASANRTANVANKIADDIRKQPGVTDAIIVQGYDILAGAAKANSAIIFTRLDSWDERMAPGLGVQDQVMKVLMNGSHVPEARVVSFNAPSLPGIGTVGGFTLMIEDKGGNTIEQMDKISKEFMAAARKRPEIGMIYSTFGIDTPGYRFDVDREKAEQLGVPVKDVFTALQTFLGGVQVNDFNRFGRTYKVVMQADEKFRNDVEDTRFFFVRSSSGAMIPLNTLLKPQTITAPPVIKRYNGYRAIQVGGNQAPGYSSGQALAALEEVAAQTLPTDFSYEWADQSREEKISAGRAPFVFGFALLFVFLCLAALYESFGIPFAVLLSVPTGIFGAFLFQYVRNLQNDVYMQIGMVMLIGLAAKNAILIVEYAKVRVDRGMDPVSAAIEAAKLRLRPIIMTSLAFIIGCLPLVIATGAGAGARNSMGTAVVGGMLAATTLGIFLIPVLFVLIENGVGMIKNYRVKHTKTL